MKMEPDSSFTYAEITNPNHLQEITLEANGSLFDQTKTSPMCGRSVKDYDEQLSNLKKENFNLKLRIYFLEEKIGTSFPVADKENVIRKNVEYQIQIETLRHQLNQKQELFCEAVKALELEDEEHKKFVSGKELQIASLNERIVELEVQLQAVAEVNNVLAKKQETYDDKSAQEAFVLHTTNGYAQLEIDKLNEYIAELQIQLSEERNLRLENESAKVKTLQKHCEILENELELNRTKVEDLITELENNNKTISIYSSRIRTLEEKTTSTRNNLQLKCEEVDEKNRIIEEQITSITELRKQFDELRITYEQEQNQMDDLKSNVKLYTETIADLEFKLDTCKNVIQNLETEMDVLTNVNSLQQSSGVKSTGRLDYSSRRLTPSSSVQDVSQHSINLLKATDQCTDMVIQLRGDLKRKSEQVSKLEFERKGACNIIQKFISHTKDLEREIAEMKPMLQKKNKELEEIYENRMFPTLPVASVSSTAAAGTYRTDKEKSVMEGSEMDVAAIDNFSHCDSTTLEWENQLETLMAIIEDKETQLSELKTVTEEKDNKIIELETEVEELKIELNSVNKKLDELKSEKLQEIDQVEVKDKKIEQLESDVRKHTFNLQGIVNRELWEKNREIEKLQNKFTEKLKLNEQQITKLETDLNLKEMQMNLLKETISELELSDGMTGVSSLEEQLKASNEKCKNLNNQIAELRLLLNNKPERDSNIQCDYLKLKQDLESSEKMRLETANLCTLLTTRLEELAYFLDSLLKHKSVLGVLGSKQRSVIKQAIDQSLDLSKSLSVSITDDPSLAQLSSISGLLNTSQQSVANLLDSSLIFNSHLSQQKTGTNSQNDIIKEQTEIINVLRSQIETMKKEIEIRDMELCKQTESSLKNDSDLVEHLFNMQQINTNVLSPEKIFNQLISVDLSESEAWSEPDRHVSKARIGLETTSVSLRNKSAASINDASTSDSTEKEQNRSRNRTPSKRDSGSIETRHTIQLLQNNVTALEEKLKEKENEITILQDNLVKIENNSLEMKLKVAEEIAKLKNDKFDIDSTLKEMEEKLKTSIEEKEIVSSKLELLNQSLEIKKLEWKSKFESMEQNTELKLIELKKQYETNWIRKEEMTNRLAELQTICTELDMLKQILKQTDSQLKTLETNEIELKNKLKNAEEKNRELKREANESTLLTSQAVLERTKINNEKLKLESELRKLEQRDSERSKQLDEKDKSFNNMKNELQKQLTQLEQQKSCLQLKVSELETLNAELHNRLVKIQTNNLETIWSKNTTKVSNLLPNFKVFGKHSLVGLSRQRSDMSGYVSEDVLTDENDGGLFNRTAPEGYWFHTDTNQNVNDVRTLANSSPDLGIESDQGRFSSLETNVATSTTTTRPLLQTLELTASMNNLLSTDHINNGGYYCNILTHKNLENETMALKKRILCLDTNLDKARSQLTLINQNKKQVEKAVCKQIHKTSIVLRQARANLDSSSETEMKRK